jgi:hypothetical protein
MRPLKGIILSVSGGWMKIHLAAGDTITTRRVTGMKRGERVEVSYDFTRNRVRDIRLAGEKDEPKLIEPKDEEVELHPPEEETGSETPPTPDLSRPKFEDDEEEWRWEKEMEEGGSPFPKSEGL